MDPLTLIADWTFWNKKYFGSYDGLEVARNKRSVWHFLVYPPDKYLSPSICFHLFLIIIDMQRIPKNRLLSISFSRISSVWPPHILITQKLSSLFKPQNIKIIFEMQYFNPAKIIHYITWKTITTSALKTTNLSHSRPNTNCEHPGKCIRSFRNRRVQKDG